MARSGFSNGTIVITIDGQSSTINVRGREGVDGAVELEEIAQLIRFTLLAHRRMPPPPHIIADE